MFTSSKCCFKRMKRVSNNNVTMLLEKSKIPEGEAQQSSELYFTSRYLFHLFIFWISIFYKQLGMAETSTSIKCADWRGTTAQVWDTMLVPLLNCSQKKQNAANILFTTDQIGKLLGLPGSSLDAFRNFFSLMSCSCYSSWSSSSKGRSQPHTAFWKDRNISKQSATRSGINFQ